MAEIVGGILAWFRGRHPASSSSRSSAAAATPTAILATRWRGIWRSSPLFLRDADLLHAPSEDEPSRAAATIGRILADHPGPFAKVHLTCYSYASRERELAEWARLLAARGVQDLILISDRDIPPCTHLYCASHLTFSAVPRCNTSSLENGLSQD